MDSISDMKPDVTDSRDRQRVLSRIAEWRPIVFITRRLWGYDFFISYHWKSGGSYAVALAQRLRDARFDVFLDRAEYASGDDWLLQGRLALRHTKRLILVATREAVTESEPVLREVEAFLARSRAIIPLVFDDESAQLPTFDSQVLRLIPPTTLYVAERAENRAVGPSNEALQRLVQAHAVMRRRTFRRLFVSVAFLVLLVAAIVAAIQRASAIASRNDLASQLASMQYQKSFDFFRQGRDRRIALLYAIKAALLAPNHDPRRSLYIDRAVLLATMLPSRTINLDGPARELVRGTISPDLCYLAAVTTNFSVRTWDLRNGASLKMPVHNAIAGYSGDNAVGDERDRGLMSLAISPDSRRALGRFNGDLDKDRICVWELTTGELIVDTTIDANESRNDI